LSRVDYIIAPLKVLQSLKESVASPDEKYSFVRRLSPQSAGRYVFSDEEVWFQPLISFVASLILNIVGISYLNLENCVVSLYLQAIVAQHNDMPLGSFQVIMENQEPIR
jgi:hypothetical protein